MTETENPIEARQAIWGLMIDALAENMDSKASLSVSKHTTNRERYVCVKSMDTATSHVRGHSQNVRMVSNLKMPHSK